MVSSILTSTYNFQGTTAPGQSEHGSNDNEGVSPHSPDLQY